MASFAKLLRNSNFVRLGDLSNKLLVGKIVHRVQNDLYVDVGLKFNAVCKAPVNTKDEVYVVGSKVLVRLFDTELSEKFLGSKHDLTLLEADARIISLYNPARHRQQELQKIGT